MEDLRAKIGQHDFLLRQTGVSEYPPVGVEDTSIRSQHHHGLRDGIHHLPQLPFGLRDLRKRRFQSCLGAFAFDGNACDAACVVNQLHFTRLRTAYFPVMHAESAQHAAVVGKDGARPGRAESRSHGDVPEVRPARVRKYVDGKDRLAKERGGAARSGIGADGEAIRRLPVGRRQARGSSVTQVQTILFKQENRAKHALALGFDQQREAPQHFVQGCVEKNHLQGIQHCLAGKRCGADWRRGWPVFRDASWRFYVFHK